MKGIDVSPEFVRPDGHRFAPTEAEAYWAVEVRPVRPPDDFGLFAGGPIRAGAVIGRDGGQVLSSIAGLPPELQLCALIGENLFLAPADFRYRDPLSYLNHSCDSSVTRIGGLIFAARREIAAGEELTLDYAPLVSGLPRWRMECACGSPRCRGEITGDDWQVPDLARALWPEWLPFIQREILSRGILDS